jgi:tRNA threonylcarbamoyladenosine biosynthesis protein TsaB
VGAEKQFCANIIDMILAIKTNFEPAEIYVLDDFGNILRQKKWTAERTLAKKLLDKLSKFLGGDFKRLTGLVVFSGPGSFTGLRIGITVANTIAYTENIPIVGAGGDDWLKTGVNNLKTGKNNKIVVPEYGQEAHTTKPKK